MKLPYNADAKNENMMMQWTYLYAPLENSLIIYRGHGRDFTIK